MVNLLSVLFGTTVLDNRTFLSDSFYGSVDTLITMPSTVFQNCYGRDIYVDTTHLMCRNPFSNYNLGVLAYKILREGLLGTLHLVTNPARTMPPASGQDPMVFTVRSLRRRNLEFLLLLFVLYVKIKWI